MPDLLHAFVSGIGAGLAFALCQAVMLRLAERREYRRRVAQTKAMQAAVDQMQRHWQSGGDGSLASFMKRATGEYDAN